MEISDAVRTRIAAKSCNGRKAATKRESHCVLLLCFLVPLWNCSEITSLVDQKSPSRKEISWALVSTQVLGGQKFGRLWFTFSAAEQRPPLAWGETNRALASVRETPGHASHINARPAAIWRRHRQIAAGRKGEVVGQPGAAACSPEARSPCPRLTTTTAPQFLYSAEGVPAVQSTWIYLNPITLSGPERPTLPRAGE